MGQLTVLVTGASGFLGAHVVSALRQRGHSVVALVRQTQRAPQSWLTDQSITTVVSDLLDPTDELLNRCADCDAVVHCAALMSGTDQDHAAATLPMTEQAGRMMSKGAHLVLVSSLSVYDVSSLAAFAELDETSPLEGDGAGRDAYCRAKLAQEQIARRIASERELGLSILRPGAIFGPGRLWNSHVGIAQGPILVRIGKRGQIPLSFVDHTAEAIALAVEDRKGCGVVNVVDDDLPERGAFVTALRLTGWPRATLPLSYSLFKKLAPIVGNLPGSPGLFRRKTLAARLQPQRYSNALLHDRLGWTPRFGFEQAMRRSIERNNP